jgi:hypothetical protein
VNQRRTANSADIAFDSKLEAQQWGHEQGYLKKKPVETKRRDAEGEGNVRWFRDKDGHWRVWINRQGKASAGQKTWLAAGGAKPSKLYTTKEKEGMAKSSSAKPRKVVSDAEMRAAEAGARERMRAVGKKSAAEIDETIRNIRNSGRTPGQRLSALNLQGKGGSSSGMGALCVKQTEWSNGKPLKKFAFRARAVVILKSDGSLGSQAKPLANAYARAVGKEIPVGSPEKWVRSTLKEAIRGGYFIQQYGNKASAKCLQKGEASGVNDL